MVFKVLEGAQKSWRGLDEHNQLAKLVLGVTFNDGIEVIEADRPSTRNCLTGPAVAKNWRQLLVAQQMRTEPQPNARPVDLRVG